MPRREFEPPRPRQTGAACQACGLDRSAQLRAIHTPQDNRQKAGRPSRAREKRRTSHARPPVDSLQSGQRIASAAQYLQGVELIQNSIMAGSADADRSSCRRRTGHSHTDTRPPARIHSHTANAVEPSAGAEVEFVHSFDQRRHHVFHGRQVVLSGCGHRTMVKQVIGEHVLF